MAWWEGLDETRVLIAPGGKEWDTSYSFNIPNQEMQHAACYLYIDGVLLDLHRYRKSYVSWFLGGYVSGDGWLYTATPVDPVFIPLPLFKEARMKNGDDPGKFRLLDEIIYIDGYPGYQHLSSLTEKLMLVVCDFKVVGAPTEPDSADIVQELCCSK